MCIQTAMFVKFQIQIFLINNYLYISGSPTQILNPLKNLKRKMFITLSQKNKNFNNIQLANKIHTIDLKSAKCISKKLKTQLNSYDITAKLKIEKRKATYRKPYFQIKNSIVNQAQKHASAFTTKDNSRQRSRANSIESIIHQQYNEEYLNKLKESQKKYKRNFKQSNNSPQINKNTRIIMLDWLFQLWSQLQLPKNVIYNAIEYVDKFVYSNTVKKTQYQKLGLCTLFMATKLEMSEHPSIYSFLESMDNIVSREQFIQTQKKIVKCLKFKLNPPTLYQIMILLIFMMKSFKTIYNKFDWASLPLIQKNDQCYLNIFWILDGVVLQGFDPKFSKQDVCLSIIYIELKKSRQQLFCYQKNQYENFDKQNLHQNSNRKVGKFQISFQCFMSYVCSKNKTIDELYQCIDSLKKWIKVKCNCFSPTEESYHKELKQIVTKKRSK